MSKLTISIVVVSILAVGAALLLQGDGHSSPDEKNHVSSTDKGTFKVASLDLDAPVKASSGPIITKVLITDFYNHRVIVVDRTDTTDHPSGTIIWQYGNVNNLYAPPPGIGHGIGPNQLFKPHTSAPLPNGHILISDWGNHRIIEVDSNKNIVWQYGNANNEYNDINTVAGHGTGFNQLYFPHDADRFADGTTLITDAKNSRIILVDMDKNILWQFGDFTFGHGPNQLNWPTHSHMLPNGNVLVSDLHNHRVVEIDPTDTTDHPNGTIVWQYGTTGVSGQGPNQLYRPMNVIGLDNGNVMICDWYNHRVIEVNKANEIVWQYGVTGIAGTGPNYMRDPEAAYITSNGNTLIADTWNKRIVEIDRTDTTDSPNGTIVYQYGKTNVSGSGPGETNCPPDGEEIIGTFPASAVLGRNVFYNNSAFDDGEGATDDDAIAPDKTALLPGQTATFANYTSYELGINGIMVDIAGLPGTPTAAADFAFKVGNDNNPAGWAAAPAPTSVTVREGAGVDGSDRITIIWADNDNVIQKQWLQVTVKATAATGLASDDVFYFGNAIGETGDSAADARVTPTDQIGVRNNPHTIGGPEGPASIDDAYDFNRDKKVGPQDEVSARENGTSSKTALKLITAP